jgi:hypothetical protein
MNKCRVVGDDIELDKSHMALEFELELAQTVGQAEKTRIEDGRSPQIRLERNVLSHDEGIEERGELLEHAITLNTIERNVNLRGLFDSFASIRIATN